MGQEGLDGVHVFNPDGKLIGRINLPGALAPMSASRAAPIAIRLFMAASTLDFYSLLREHPGYCGRWAGKGVEKSRRGQTLRARPSAIGLVLRVVLSSV
jgi:sugar lactone lactonase YvrE